MNNLNNFNFKCNYLPNIMKYKIQKINSNIQFKHKFKINLMQIRNTMNKLYKYNLKKYQFE